MCAVNDTLHHEEKDSKSNDKKCKISFEGNLHYTKCRQVFLHTQIQHYGTEDPLQPAPALFPFILLSCFLSIGFCHFYVPELELQLQNLPK